VLLLGDSLAVGLKVPMAQLALDSGAAIAAHGIVGSRIANWANSPTLASDMSFNPTLVLLSLGTNDMKMTSPGAEAGDLSALLAKLRAGGAEVIILAPPTMPFPDHGVRNMLAASGATIFPSDALSIPRGPDGIHPTVRGYGGWSGAIWAWL
jgi:lysophospholipase L1-like esterase